MTYRLSTVHLTMMLAAPVVAGAAWLAWPTRSYEEWIAGLIALTFLSLALMTARYEMEVADGKVELRSVLTSRSLQLKDVKHVTLYWFRGNKVIALRTDSALLYVPTYMRGLTALVEAIQAANPTVSIDSRIVPRGRAPSSTMT